MAHREPTQAELEAAHWLVVLDEPRVSRQDIDAFQAWLAADETHKRAYDAVSATADKIDAVLATEPVEHEIGHRRTRVPVRPIAIAALSAAAALALFVISPLSPLRDEPGAVYATAPEQERLVRLSDGTTIEMAPGARLRASLEGDDPCRNSKSSKSAMRSSVSRRRLKLKHLKQHGSTRATGAALGWMPVITHWIAPIWRFTI